MSKDLTPALHDAVAKVGRAKPRQDLLEAAQDAVRRVDRALEGEVALRRGDRELLEELLALPDQFRDAPQKVSDVVSLIAQVCDSADRLDGD